MGKTICEKASLLPRSCASSRHLALVGVSGPTCQPPATGKGSVCWDNAAAESFFAALKNEMYYRRSWPTRARARFAVAEYIEVFYNRRRLHSTLGYRTPFEALTDHQRAATAA